MKAIIIGGTFDMCGGRHSGLIRKLALALHLTGQYEDGPYLINGGHIDDINMIIDDLDNAYAVFWFPNIPNEFEKNRDIKKRYPTKMLITSKRNEQKYTFKDLVSMSLELKANLTVEFCPTENQVVSRVFDPLGNVWCQFTSDIDVLAKNLTARLLFISGVTRQGTILSTTEMSMNEDDIRDPEFFEIVKSSAEMFHSLVDPEGKITRMLGNASFRCARGFPSFRSLEDDSRIFVSQRNVDKRYICKNTFVPTKLIYHEAGGQSVVYYSGTLKPSVDTPVQLRLYQIFPAVNFMIHSHVYVENAPFTDKAIPCGAIEEVYEILKCVDCNTSMSNFAINLLGHGNIVFANDCSYFNTIKYISRCIPEIIINDPCICS